MLLPLFLLIAVSTASKVQFKNNCGKSIDVIRTANGQAPAQQCRLGKGQTCEGEFSGNAMTFKDGSNGKTLAEFTFNLFNGLDFYDLSVIAGYDTAIQITSSTGSRTITCQDSKCADANHSPTENKIYSTPSGGTFVVTFCP